jgi:hypothetical protein
MTAITGKQSAFSTILKADALNGDLAGTYRSVAYITHIKGPGLTLSLADATAHDSPNGWREKIATILEAGVVTFTIAYDPAEVTVKYVNGLLGKMVAKTLEGFKVLFPNNTVEASRSTWAFNAFITKFEPGMPVDEKLTADIELDLSGEPTIV